MALQMSDSEFGMRLAIEVSSTRDVARLRFAEVAPDGTGGVLSIGHSPERLLRFLFDSEGYLAEILIVGASYVLPTGCVSQTAAAELGALALSHDKLDELSSHLVTAGWQSYSAHIRRSVDESQLAVDLASISGVGIRLVYGLGHGGLESRQLGQLEHDLRRLEAADLRGTGSLDPETGAEWIDLSTGQPSFSDLLIPQGVCSRWDCEGWAIGGEVRLEYYPSTPDDAAHLKLGMNSDEIERTVAEGDYYSPFGRSMYLGLNKRGRLLNLVIYGASDVLPRGVLERARG